MDKKLGEFMGSCNQDFSNINKIQLILVRRKGVASLIFDLSVKYGLEAVEGLKYCNHSVLTVFYSYACSAHRCMKRTKYTEKLGEFLGTYRSQHHETKTKSFFNITVGKTLGNFRSGGSRG